jgi:hypothetical protein
MIDSYPDTFAVVEIHLWDEYEEPWGSWRQGFYGSIFQGTPCFVYDGLWDAWPISTYISKFLTRQPVPTDVTIELRGNEVASQTFDIGADVCIEAGGTGKTMRIYMVETLDNYPTSPSYSRQTFRQAADEPGTETDITLAPGECTQVLKTFAFDELSWTNKEDIKIIAWAQVPSSGGGAAEVYQAAQMAWPFPPLLALLITLPDGIPEFITPGEETNITVSIEDAGEIYVPGTGQLHHRYDGGTYLTSDLVSLGGSLYQATLPPAACGDTPEFYFSAQGDEGSTVYLPADAPTTVYTTTVANVVTVIDDDFETDQGWTVENDPGLVDGPWERADPRGDCDRGDPPSDFDGSGYCYVTDNDLTNCNSDVDGGPTHLISPSMDMTGLVDPILSYAYWWANDDQDGDPFTVAISNDDGGSWTVMTTYANIPEGWFEEELHVDSYIEPTSTMKIRFSAHDLGGSSIDEGGVDAVRILDITCAGEPSCDDGILNQGEDRIDCGGPCPPCECLSDGECDNGLYCDGSETCDAWGFCQAGTYPCASGHWCHEVDDACIAHGSGDAEPDGDVDLVDFMRFQDCFGDVAGVECYPMNLTGDDGMIDLADHGEFVGVLGGP